MAEQLAPGPGYLSRELRGQDCPLYSWSDVQTITPHTILMSLQRSISPPPLLYPLVVLSFSSSHDRLNLCAPVRQPTAIPTLRHPLFIVISLPLCCIILLFRPTLSTRFTSPRPLFNGDIHFPSALGTPGSCKLFPP